ncbi:MAG: hypothetical protein Q9218_004768 [Villophora microphyllina]
MNGHIHQKPLINLLRGWPNPSLLPTSQIKAASAAALSDTAISIPGLLYGPDPGYEPLRESVASWLSRFYQLKAAVSPKRICITGGASQNLACLLQVFSDPLYTKNVWLVSPTYFRVCPIFHDNAFHGRLRSVPEDEQGIDVGFLRQHLREADEKALQLSGDIDAQRVATVATMTISRRQELIQVARDHDALVITDDVYDQLQWPAQKSPTSSSLQHAILPRVIDIDRQLEGGTGRKDADGFGNAVSNGSFSKIAAPGTRCGWAEGTEKFAFALSQCGSSASGGAPSQMTSTFMTDLLESGELDKHIYTTLQPSYAQRYYSMMDAIEKHLLPLGVTLPQSDRDVVGGYFLWIALPEPLLADDVAQHAKEEENLIIGQGSLFAVAGDERTTDLERQVRVCFSWEEEERLGEGIERLATVISRMLGRLSDGDWSLVE